MLTEETIGQMRKHALSSPDTEVCGLVFDGLYVPVPNLVQDGRRFYADPIVLAKALSKYGEPAAVFHTHPSGSLCVSQEDLRQWYYFCSTMIIGTIQKGRLQTKAYPSSASE